MPLELTRNMKHILLSLAVCFLSFFMHYKFFLMHPDPHHDGVMLKPALDVASGATLFRDTFTHYGPIATYFNAIGVKLLGPSLVTIRIVTNFSYALTFALMALALLRFLPVMLALFAVFFQMIMIGGTALPWSSVHANLFMTASFTALVFMKESRYPSLLAGLAGFCCALTFWCRQAVGIGAITAMMSILLVASIFLKKHFTFRDFLSFTAGVILGLGVFLFNFWLSGSYQAWHLQNIVWPKLWEIHMRGVYSKDTLSTHMFSMLIGDVQRLFRTFWTYPAIICLYSFIVSRLSRFSKSIQISATLLLFPVFYGMASYLPKVVGVEGDFGQVVFLLAVFVGVCAFVYSLFREISDDAFRLLLLGGFVAASWLHIYPLPDETHLTWAIVFSFVYLIYLSYVLLNKNLFMTITSFFVFFTPLIMSRTKLIYERLQISTVPLIEGKTSILSGVLLNKNLPISKDDIIDCSIYVESIIRKFPELPILNYTDHALFAALAKNRKMADPYYIWWGWIDFPKFMGFNWNSRLSYIRENHPLIVIHSAFEPQYTEFMKSDDYVLLKQYGDNLVLAHSSLAQKWQ